VRPKRSIYFYVEHCVENTNVENLFSFEVKIGSSVKSYADGGRIRVEFPKKTEDGANPLFSDDLGYTGKDTGSILGCWFRSDSAAVSTGSPRAYVYPMVGKKLQCRLIKS
jgi:hypothetical protein